MQNVYYAYMYDDEISLRWFVTKLTVIWVQVFKGPLYCTPIMRSNVTAWKMSSNVKFHFVSLLQNEQ